MSRDAFRKRKEEGGAAEKLAAELADLAAKRGQARKRREDVHRIAEANKGFAHFLRS